MEKVVWKYLTPTIAGLIGLAVILFLIHPLAPLVLGASLLIQAPIVWLLVTSAYSNSYKDRTRERIKRFEKDDNIEKWLKEEEAELKSLGRKYWSKGGKSLSALNRAQIYAQLKEWEQVSVLLSEIEIKRLSSLDLPRYEKIQQQLAMREDG